MISNFKTSNTTIMDWKSKQKHVFFCLKSSSGSHIAYRIKPKLLSMLFNAFYNLSATNFPSLIPSITLL